LSERVTVVPEIPITYVRFPGAGTNPGLVLDITFPIEMLATEATVISGDPITVFAVVVVAVSY
jgi:hypothetical protein